MKIAPFNDLMPTTAGDAVIQHRRASSSRYFVWEIVGDGQQMPDFSVSPPVGAIGWNAAVRLARRITDRTGGSIFALEWESGAWSRLA